jgi:hypothetical protein
MKPYEIYFQHGFSEKLEKELLGIGVEKYEAGYKWYGTLDEFFNVYTRSFIVHHTEPYTRICVSLYRIDSQR